MEQRPAVMSKSLMVRETERSKSRVESWIKLAEEVSSDAKHDLRVKKCECKACFYASRVGGAAMTERACMCCGAVTLYGSTATDVLCQECAEKHSLCKHCGGDLELRIRRKNWPDAEIILNSEEI